jgi:curved DNA-binding protein CbpA
MNEERTDLYDILGLARHATQAQISHAYRALLRRHHPDTRTPAGQSHGPVSDAAASDAALQQVLAAYAVLGNPGRRANYDRRNGVPHRVGIPPSGEGVHPRPSGANEQPPIQVGPVRWHR